jgi:hypothetical protein
MPAGTYGGCNPVLALVDKYPELMFAGKVEHEQQCVDGTHYIVGARNLYESVRCISYDEFDPDVNHYGRQPPRTSRRSRRL